MELKDYLAAQDWQHFQKIFFQRHWCSNNNITSRLCPLLKPPHRFTCFDLIRSSLVRAGRRPHSAVRDENMDTRSADHSTVFRRYAEHAESMQWTTARLSARRHSRSLRSGSRPSTGSSGSLPAWACRCETP